jgi:hypothetical protein
MKSSADAMSELMAGSMTTTGRTMDVTARLTYVPRDPHVITVTITDRAGAIPIWTIVMGTLELVPQDEEFRQLNLDAELGWLIA